MTTEKGVILIESGSPEGITYTVTYNPIWDGKLDNYKKAGCKVFYSETNTPITDLEIEDIDSYYEETHKKYGKQPESDLP